MLSMTIRMTTTPSPPTQHALPALLLFSLKFSLSLTMQQHRRVMRDIQTFVVIHGS
jgi:hypothetical protein